jgi:hypothetical protein
MSQRRIEYDWGVAYLNEHGQCHRDDGPAVTRFFSKVGSVEEWWLNGKVHRINGPAETLFVLGKVIESWSVNDRFIRVY